MQYIGLIISIVLFLVFAAIEYNIFGSSGFKGVVIFKIVLILISLFISMLLSSLSFNLQILLSLVPTLIVTFIGVLISTAMEYYAFSKANSFFMFLIYNILITILIVIGFSLIIFVIMCFIDPSMLLNNVILIIFLSVLIVITIIIVCCIIKFIGNRKLKKVIKDKVKNKLETIENDENNEDEESISFCPACGFKLARNAKFCMRCGKHF